MCGFSGEIRKDGGFASASRVSNMAERLARRGPDGCGVYQHGPVAFAHRRLKIIDLSERAHQPMVDAELGLSLVFNGCIYNHVELRRELEQKGHRFFSTGDTEVVLKAYKEWGSRCVERFYGMFAFAIAERDTGRVCLARDRLGIKPLYYADTPNAFRFASTLPALLAGGEIDTSIDPVALQHYMTFHSVVPAPRTLLRGVQKLPPATVLVLEPDGSRQQSTYWTLQFAPDPKPSFEAWQDELLDVLKRSVARRLVSDVPVGLLLSGGLDSSLLVGLLRECGQQNLATFSIGFESVRDEQGDEFRYSDIVAKRFDTDHHKIFVSPQRTLENLDACIRAMSEPMVSHDNIGFYLLSQEVSKSIKVVQSGQGADEVFAGYHWYPPLMQSTDPVADYARVFFDRDFAEYRSAVNPDLVSEDHASAFVRDHFAAPGADRAIDKALRLDSTVMLVDDPVKRVDNMTMAWGLEARVPFLDHDVLELAGRIPAEHKVAGGGKYVLKEAARRVIPAEVIDRPKGYFPVPALKYLEGPFLERVRDTLSSDTARHRGLFRTAHVETLLQDPASHLTPLRGSKLWQMALLELWLQSHEL